MKQSFKRMEACVCRSRRGLAGFLAVMLLAVLIVPLFQYTVSHAASGVVDGNTWCYTLSNGCATHVYPSGTITLSDDESLTVPEKIGAYTVTSVGNTDYDSYSGTGWGGAKNIYLPDTVTAIESVGFQGNKSLVKISGRNVTSVGGRSFYRNTALREVYFPNLTTVNMGGFAYCWSLENAYFPKLVTIGDAAFYEAFCERTSFYIGNGVTSVGTGAFYGARMKLLEIHAVSPVPESSNPNAIFNSNYADYYNNSNWYGQTVHGGFEACSNLTDVVIGAEVQYFWGRSFSSLSLMDRTFYFLNPNITLRSYSDNFSHYTDTPPSGYVGGCNYKVMTLVYAPENGYLNTYVSQYAAKAANQVNVYSPEEWEAMGNIIPSAIPKEYVKPESITAAYSGSVTEGMDLDPANVSITVRYSDGSKATIAGSTAGVTFNTRVVSSVGTNSIMVYYNDLSTSMSVMGIAKVVTGITATLNESYLNASSVAGWNGAKKAFEVGSPLVPDMFIVQENYNNGTSSTLPSEAYALNANRVNNLQGNVITITKIGTAFTTTVTVTGYSASLDGVMDDLQVPAGDYNALSKKITDMNNELIAKTGELNQKIAELGAYEAAMKEIKASIGKDGSSVSIEELPEISAMVAQKMQELAELKKGLQELEAQLAEIMGQEMLPGEASAIENIRVQLEAVNARLVAAEAQAAALSKFAASIKEQLGLSADATEDEVLARIDEIQTQLNATKDELGELQAAMEKIKEQIGAGSDESTEDLEAIIALVKEKTEKLEYMESQMKELEAALNAMLGDGSSTEDATLESVKERLEAVGAELEDVRKAAAGLTAFGDSLRSQLGLSGDATEDEVLARVTGLLKQVANDKVTKEQLLEELEKLKSGIRVLEADKTSLEAKLSALDKENAVAGQKVASLEKEKLDLGSKVSALEKDKAGLDSRLSASEKDKAALEKEKIELSFKVSGLEKDKAELKKEKTELSSKVSGLEKDKAELKKEKTELSSKVSGLQKDKTALKKETAGLSSKVSGLEKDKATLKKKTAELGSKISALEKDKATLKKKNESLNTGSSSSGAKNQNATSNESVDKLQEKVKSLENKANTLKTQNKTLKERNIQLVNANKELRVSLSSQKLLNEQMKEQRKDIATSGQGDKLMREDGQGEQTAASEGSNSGKASTNGNGTTTADMVGKIGVGLLVVLSSIGEVVLHFRKEY